MRLFALLLTLALALSLSAADWPQLLGPTRDGHSTETKLNWDWAKDGPPFAGRRTSVPAGPGRWSRAGSSSCSIASDDEEVLECLDPATGKRQWTSSYETKYRDDFGFDNGPRATPTIADGTVFYARRQRRPHGLNVEGGKRIWHRNIRDDYKADKGFFGVACSPLVIGKKLLVNVGGKGAGVVAFDVTSGKELWKSTDDPASYSSPVDGRDRRQARGGLLDAHWPAGSRSREREGSLRVSLPSTAQRERAGGDAARLEGPNLPDGVVLNRRGPTPGEEG